MNERVFLDYSISKLEQLSGRIEDCLSRLTDDQIWSRQTENENAAGNLVLHLCGNMRLWIGTGIAGQPDVRDRDAEFAARGGATASELAERLRGGVAEVTGILRQLQPARLSERCEIQNYKLTVLEAVYHVVEHFSYHTGQIVFATKLFTGQDLGYYRHLSRAPHGEKTP